MPAEGATEALKELPDVGEEDEDKIEVAWDKDEFDVCITEWTKQGHVVYKVKGSDKSGEFDIMRRYNHFFVLRQVLVQRWPAFFIPPIPPKKAMGNKEEKVVQERWYLLNRFIQHLSKIEYIWNSDEVAAFIRPTMDVEKSLVLMSKMTTE